MAFSDSSYSNPYDPADIPLRRHAALVTGAQGQGFEEWTPYSGPRSASWNPYQQQAYNKAGPGYGNFQGFGQGLTGRGTSLMSSGNRAIGRGQGLTGNYDTAQGYYGDAINKGTQFGEAGLGEAFGGYGGAMDKGYALGDKGLGNAYDNYGQQQQKGYEFGEAGLGAAFGGYGQMAQQDPFSFAAKAGNNPYMDSMVDASSRDVVRNLTEQALPGIAGQSASMGTLGSSRRGMLEGIATRGASDRIADIGAQLRGGAYQQGIGQGLQQQQFGTQGLANLGQFGIGQGNFGTQGMNNLGQFGIGQGNFGTQGMNNLGQFGTGQGNFGTIGMQNLGQIGLQQGNLGASGMMGLGQAGQGMMGLGSNMMGQGAGLGNTGYNIFNGANQGQYNMGLNRQQDHQMRMGRDQQHYYLGQQMPYQQAAAGMNVLMPWSNAYGQSFAPGAGAISGNQWTGMGIDLASQAGMAAATGGMSGITGALGNMFGGQPASGGAAPGNSYNGAPIYQGNQAGSGGGWQFPGGTY